LPANQNFITVAVSESTWDHTTDFTSLANSATHFVGYESIVENLDASLEVKPEASPIFPGGFWWPAGQPTATDLWAQVLDQARHPIASRWRPWRGEAESADLDESVDEILVSASEQPSTRYFNILVNQVLAGVMVGTRRLF
jgi:hypothetical protein